MNPRSREPEPGQTIILLDESETRIRQFLSGDRHLAVYEVRDDRGQIVFISAGQALGLWVETEI